MSDRPVAFRDLPADAFPFRVEFRDQRGTVVHQIEVAGPGAVEVPGLAGLFGPVSVRIHYANGQVVDG